MQRRTFVKIIAAAGATLAACPDAFARSDSYAGTEPSIGVTAVERAHRTRYAASWGARPGGGSVDKVTSTDGTAITFERSGEGPAVVLVDGAFCYRAN